MGVSQGMTKMGVSRRDRIPGSNDAFSGLVDYVNQADGSSHLRLIK